MKIKNTTDYESKTSLLFLTTYTFLLITWLICGFADACLFQRGIRPDAGTGRADVHRASRAYALPPGEGPMAIAPARSVRRFLIKSKLARGCRTEHRAPFCLSHHPREGVKCRRNGGGPQEHTSGFFCGHVTSGALVELKRFSPCVVQFRCLLRSKFW